MTDQQFGACLCGRVRFMTKGPLRGVVYCHCGQCRKQTGHYLAATDVRDENIVIEGGDNLTWFAASEHAQRGFCKSCGSIMFWKRNGSDKVSVTAGVFTEPTGLVSECHIFVADKGDYYDITDDLPQFERSTPKIPVAGD